MMKEIESRKTTYDEVYTLFHTITKVDECSLPSTEEGIYLLINSARIMFNRKLYDKLEQDNTMETFDRELNDNEVLLMVFCLRLITFMNMFSELSSMISMSTKDTAIKDYKSQSTARRQLIFDEKKNIDNLVLSMMEDTQTEGVR